MRNWVGDNLGNRVPPKNSLGELYGTSYKKGGGWNFGKSGGESRYVVHILLLHFSLK